MFYGRNAKILLKKRTRFIKAEFIYVYKNLNLIIEYYVHDHYVYKREKIHKFKSIHFQLNNAA